MKKKNNDFCRTNGSQTDSICDYRTVAIQRP